MIGSANSASAGFPPLAETDDIETLYQAGVRAYGEHPDAARDRLASQYWGKAALKGHAPSQTSMGMLCEAGRGMPLDAKRAQLWYERAAKQGDAQAKARLAAMKQPRRPAPKAPAEATPDEPAKSWIVRWLLPPVFLVLGLGGLSYGIDEWRKESAFDSRGRTLSATVLQVSKTTSRSTTRYRAQVKFETESHQQIETWVKLSHSVGETLYDDNHAAQTPIVYLPESPDVAKGADADSETVESFLMGFFALGYLGFDMRQRWRRYQGVA